MSTKARRTCAAVLWGSRLERARGRKRAEGELSVHKWLKENAERMKRMGLHPIAGPTFRRLERRFAAKGAFRDLVLARLKIGRRNGPPMLAEDFEDLKGFRARHSIEAQSVSVRMIRR